ncbi:MAG: hypothetical protein HY042_09190 [Spirochaetia bacterium]|nr:hypothetical protein [Spirochaetia bacterium]
MNKDIRKLFADVVGVSLNSDQINVIAQQMEPTFDIRRESGFGNTIAIPGLDREGKFLYDSNCKIVYKEDMIHMLGKNKWIFDPDTKRFFRDPFHAEQLNFLKAIELIDLRKSLDVSLISTKLKEEAVRLKLEDLNWQITVRTYRLGRETAALLQDVITLLLSKQELGGLVSPFYSCLNELAINASKATYKVLFEKYVTRAHGVDPVMDYDRFMQMFRTEVEENADENLARMAQADDKYFDIQFKSTDNTVSCWTTNYTTISRPEKLRFMQRLKFPIFGEEMIDASEDPHREGAGLGINLVLAILAKFSSDKQPLKPVFYPDRTKVGFVLKRTELSGFAAAQH